MGPTQRYALKFALVMDPPTRRPYLSCNEAKPCAIHSRTQALKDSPACALRLHVLPTSFKNFVNPDRRYRMATADSITDLGNEYTLDSVREALIRQEDTIIFSLIERAKFPVNSPTYDKSYAPRCDSLVEFIVKNTESIQAEAGRYKNPEENPFFPEHLSSSDAPNYSFPQILHLPSASININKSIWKMYFDELLPKIVTSGDDGNYAQTAACDLLSLQAISRRIHYGKFVAEMKFRKSPQDYEPLIRAQDREALMNLLTFRRVEEIVIKRVEKKARVFGQEVSPDHDDNQEKYKVDPSVVLLLYEKWIMPLTKLVEVEYLLRRLD